MQPRGQGGPRTPDRVRGLQRPQRRRRPWKRGGTGQILQRRDGKKRVERVELGDSNVAVQQHSVGAVAAR